MADTKKPAKKSEKKGEIGRINNEKDPGYIPPSEREIGITNNELPVTGIPAEREIGVTNNQNPRESKPDEPEIGVVHNDLEDKKRAEKKKNK